MRIGLAGAGRIGAFHASTLAGLDKVEQVVVTDVISEPAKQLAAEHGYGYAEDLDDLLAQVDAVVIATSTTSHADVLRRSSRCRTPDFLREARRHHARPRQ